MTLPLKKVDVDINRTLAAPERPIRVVGASEGMTHIRAISAQYMCENPDKTVLVPPGVGTEGGIATVTAGEAHIARITRDLTDEELALGLVQRSIFRIPIAFFANESCGVSNLTSAQISEIFSGYLRNWKDVGGRDLKVKIVSLEPSHSSSDTLRNTWSGWSEAEQNPQATMALTEQEALAKVEERFGAVGYAQYSDKMLSGTRVIAVDGSMPTDQNYPISLTVSLVWREADSVESAQNLINYICSPSVRKQFSKFGVVPTTPLIQLV